MSYISHLVAYREGKEHAQNLVYAFHVRYAHRIADGTPPTKELMNLRRHLLMEEVKELCDELTTDPDMEKVAKEVGDVLYVVYGLCVSLGIDGARALELVHDSNMTKDVRREEGEIKTQKGKGYVPPNMSSAVKR